MELAEREVRAAALAAVGEPVAPGSWHVVHVAYESGSPATGALLRVRGHAAGRDWSMFVKLLQHVRHWPLLHLVPEDVRESFAGWFPWRAELAAWDEPFAGRLPAGLRIPRLYHLTELGDDRVLVWMEDIDALADSAWSTETFARAARALGGLAALRGTPELLAADEFSSTPGLRVYVDSRVNLSALPALADDDLWRHPLVAGAVDERLRADLRRIAAALPAILDRLDTLPQALPHGDASPQNLLVPRDSPKQFVAIDIGFQGPHAIGFDLGQLLVGLAHAGVLTAGDLPAIHDRLVPAFVAGMAAYGVDADPDHVAYGYVGGLVARSALTSMPFEALGASPDDELARRFRQRAELTRYLVDLGLTLIDA